MNPPKPAHHAMDLSRREPTFLGSPQLSSKVARACCAVAALTTLIAGEVWAQPHVAPTGPGGAGWWRDDVFYEVFVRSFADADADGVGDLRGLTARLDLLNDGDPKTTTDLGVDGVWLMPIHPSPSYHGYDVVDYRGVHPDYGTLADFDAFIAAAHARGIRVIIDFVLNHASSEHPWFKAAADPKHPEHARYRDFFVWRDVAPAWKRPWDGAPVWHAGPHGRHYYGLFWGGMPDLNLENPAVLHEMTESMAFWLARGVDGFRLDAVRHLSESPNGVLVDVDGSHRALRTVRTTLEKRFPGALFVGEAWSEPAAIAKYVGAGDELHMAFSFGTAAGVMEAVGDGLRLPLWKALEEAEGAFVDRSFEAPFLTNHDMRRAMRAFGGDVTKAKLAAAVLFALPGTPFVYYGEEIGMQGGPSPADEDKRTPMRFTATPPHHGFTTGTSAWRAAPEAVGVDVATQQASGGLWRMYQELIALRHHHRALSVGTATRPAQEGGGRGAIALLREHAGERVLFIANLHSAPAPAFSVAVAGAPTVLSSSSPMKISPVGGALHVTGLGARSFAFIKLQ